MQAKCLVCVRLDRITLSTMDRIAKERKLNRSEVIRELLSSANPVKAEPKPKPKDYVPPGGAAIPDCLWCPEFREAWANWLDERRTRKKPVTPRAQAMQLKRLAAMGTTRAIAAIEASIANGWQGIFEPDSRKGKTDGNKAAILTWMEQKRKAGEV